MFFPITLFIPITIEIIHFDSLQFTMKCYSFSHFVPSHEILMSIPRKMWFTTYGLLVRIDNFNKVSSILTNCIYCYFEIIKFYTTNSKNLSPLIACKWQAMLQSCNLGNPHLLQRWV
jgi:hypothetical protein